MTLAQTYIAPWQANAAALYGARFFPAPTYLPDDFLGTSGPNAWCASVLPVQFAWRFDYPSAAMDEPLRSNEIRRTAAHESGHAFELVCLSLGIDIHRLYFEFRGFTGTWADWLLEDWKKVREGFADCFAAALLGEWLVPVGSSQADRFYNENKTVTAVAARGFFMRVTGATVPPVTPPDCSFAEWIPSPNYAVGGNTMAGILDHWTVTTTFEAALRTLTTPNGAASVSSHYLIGRDGRTAQLVHEKDRAFHVLPEFGQGVFIGIEHQHMPGEDWPTVQLEASALLHRDIAARRGLELVRGVVKGHRETGYNTACPGDLPIDRLLEDNFVMDITETRLREIIGEEVAKKTTPISDKLNPFTQNVPETWLRRFFYGFDPLTRVRTPNPTTGPVPPDLK